MKKQIISNQELTLAAIAVREAMLCSLPEPQACTGQFSVQFEEKITQLKRMEAHKVNRNRIARGAVAAVLAVLIGFSLLFAFNTEVRAAVINWFKETFGTYTSYWFQAEQENALPEYKLTWVPEGYEIVYDDTLPNSRTMIYQLGEDTSAGFVFSYCFAEEDSPFMIYTFDGEYDIEEVDVNGCYGEFYRSLNATESHALVWFDENTNTFITINAFMPYEDILHIANGVKLVK